MQNQVEVSAQPLLHTIVQTKSRVKMDYANSSGQINSSGAYFVGVNNASAGSSVSQRCESANVQSSDDTSHVLLEFFHLGPW